MITAHLRPNDRYAGLLIFHMERQSRLDYKPDVAWSWEAFTGNVPGRIVASRLPSRFSCCYILFKLSLESSSSSFSKRRCLYSRICCSRSPMFALHMPCATAPMHDRLHITYAHRSICLCVLQCVCSRVCACVHIRLHVTVRHHVLVDLHAKRVLAL